MNHFFFQNMDAESAADELQSMSLHPQPSTSDQKPSGGAAAKFKKKDKKKKKKKEF